MNKHASRPRARNTVLFQMFTFPVTSLRTNSSGGRTQLRADELDRMRAWRAGYGCSRTARCGGAA